MERRGEDTGRGDPIPGMHPGVRCLARQVDAPLHAADGRVADLVGRPAVHVDAEAGISQQLALQPPRAHQPQLLLHRKQQSKRRMGQPLLSPQLANHRYQGRHARPVIGAQRRLPADRHQPVAAALRLGSHAQRHCVQMGRQHQRRRSRQGTTPGKPHHEIAALPAEGTAGMGAIVDHCVGRQAGGQQLRADPIGDGGLPP